jgi:hypothetical protein
VRRGAPRSLAISLAGLLTAAGFAQTQPVDPKAVFDLYTKALAAGDIDQARQLAVGDEKRLPILEGRRAAAVAEKQFKAAVDKAFPGSLKPIGYGGVTTQPAEAQSPEKLTVQGDTATFITRDSLEPVRFRKFDGAWKVDLDAMYSPATVTEIETFRGALTEVMNALSAEIATGRFKSFAEVQADLETRVKMRIATPDLPATTRPN